MKTGKNLHLRKFAFEKLGEVEFHTATVQDEEIELVGVNAFSKVQNVGTFFPVTAATLVENNLQWELLVEFDTAGWPVEIDDCVSFALTDEETTLALNISLYGASDPKVQEQLTAWANKRLFNEHSII